ncbi:hypothetical protein C7M84_002285 [Penaeus vannamei]|uniref:tRNA-specific adenosine deaminase 1 n=1 Tax=Penaeus vannamei TaxID=6689 RepID=A0A423TRC1_PENVA|nr:hypothetical protein C7M84_002285 [Penaeus vannamei]
MAQPPLFPTLTPRLVDPAWFQVDKPVDLAQELKDQEQVYQEQMLAIQQKGSDIVPIGKSATEQTGAKTVGGEQEDPRLPGADYHVTGALRTKPGRGDPTLSMSCSDKIFKWTVLGVQGALLMLFLKSPVYFETITIETVLPVCPQILAR